MYYEGFQNREYTRAEKESVGKAELTCVMQVMPKFKRSTQDSISGANVVNQKTDPQHTWQRNNEFDFLYPL